MAEMTSENRKWVADYDSWLGICSSCGERLGVAIQNRPSGEKWCSKCVEAERHGEWRNAAS